MSKLRSGYFYITLISLFLLLSLVGRASAADWVENFGGFTGLHTYSQATATDASGNTYLAGYFESATLTLGSVTLTRIGSQDAFVTKLDPSGTVLWAKNFGGSGASAYGQSIAIDSSGNVYMGGYFGGNLTTPVLTKIGSSDVFALKLDSNGAITWAKNFGGSGASAYGQSIAVDGSGNVYLGGYFQYANLTTPALTKIGTQDAFAFKLDSSGATTWAKNFGGSGANAYGQGIAVDGSANVYLGGYFNGANLTTPALTKIGSSDAFALKLDSSGATTWAKNFGGSGATSYGNGIAVDGSGNVYLGGYFNSANLTTPALTKIGVYDSFALKLDSSGSTTWAKNFGGNGVYAYGQSIAVDGSGNVYLGGYFNNANLTTPALTKIGTQDAFAFKLNATGATTWARNFGGSGAYAYGRGIAVDGSGNVYLGGYFDTANLTTPALTRIGTPDAFALKLNSSGTTTWARNFGGLVAAGSSTRATATDAAGNTYLAGSFDCETLTLGSVTLTRIGSQDAFVAKLDPSGTVLWAKNFGGWGTSANGQSIAVDSSGNAYLAGDLGGNLTTPPLTRIGYQDAFALKLDSSGATTWAKNFGGSNANAFGRGIAVDSSGNVYLAGYFGGANLTTPALSRYGTQDAFALKLSSSGAITWVRGFSGSGAAVYAQGIAVDGFGNVYLGGDFRVANLTTPVLTKIGTIDAFAFKLSSSGATVWAKNFGGSGAETSGKSIAVDGSGNVYLGGYLYGANLTTPVLTKIGTSDAFAVKLSSSGANTWAKNFGGSGAGAYGNSITVDGSGNVYLGGYFQSSSLTTPALSKIGNIDAFAFKLGSTGATTWARNFGGSGAYAYGQGIAVDGSGNVFLGGYFNAANLTTPALTKIGSQDVFIIALWANNHPPTAAIQGSPTITLEMVSGSTLTPLNASPSTDPDTASGDSIVSYSWDLNNDGIFGDASGVNPSLTWAQQQTYGLASLGNHTVSVRVGDTVGATSTTSVTLRYVDTTPPSSSPSLPSGTYIGYQSVTLSCSDTGSGCAPIKYCLGTSCTPTTTYGGAIVINLSTTLNWQAFDYAGNSSTGQAVYTIYPPPTTTTGSASSIARTTATLNGTVNDNGTTTTVSFQYGPDTNYGNTASGGTVTAGSGTIPVSVDISGLTCNTTYHFRVTANSAAGTTNSNDAILTTSACLAQTITLGSAPTMAVNGTGTVSATSGSGNPVTFSSQTPSVCTTSGTNGATVTGVAAGTCTIAASQAGNANYAAAPQVTLSFNVSSALTTPPITDWAANYGGFNGSTANTQATTTDASGNTYLAGYFESDTLTLGNVTLTRIGYRDAFVAKLDASGTVLWAKNFGGSVAYTWGQGIAVDGSGNVYLGGYFYYGNLTTPAMTKIGNYDAFALKLSSTGTTIWAKNFGGSGANTYGNGIAVDGSGNVYLVGYFSSANLTTPALTKIGNYDAFALKLSSTGTTIWAKNFGGNSASAYGQGIAIDGSGNVYLGGYFSSASLTTTALTKIGGQDAFVLKLDANGATSWAKNFGGSGANTYGNGIAVDGSGNVYLGGYFDSANLTTPALTKIGSNDAFALKLDANGTTSWAKNFGGSGAYARGNGIAVDESGNVYLGGFFDGANLSIPVLTKIGSRDVFSLKLDANGTTTWAKNFGGSGAGAYGNGIAVDGSGNVCQGGYFYTANLTTPALTKIGTQDAFALKLDSTGNTTWAKNFGGLIKANTYAKATATDTAGNTYLAGYFKSTALTLGGVTLTRIGSQDAFVAKFDPSGTVLWAKNFGGINTSAYGQSIAVDGSGNVYLGGYFDSANLTTPALTRIGTVDAFALKLDSTGTITWAKNFGGSGSSVYGNGIAVDSSGNVYLGGYSQGNLTTPSLTKIGDNDAFAFKLSSTGAITWAKNFGGYSASAFGNGIAVDGSGNVYLGGYFNVYNLTIPALTLIGGRDAFAFKLSSTGTITWAKNFGGSVANTSGESIAVDGNGNVYLGGNFYNGNLTTPALTEINTGGAFVFDTFAFKLSSTGAITWAKNFGGSGASAYGNGIAVDGSGNIYVGGYFQSGNLTTPALTKIGNQDAFAFKLNSTGAITWAKNFGGNGATVYGQGIAVDGSGNIYVGGYFQSGNLTTPPLTKIGNTDAFIIAAWANNTPPANTSSASSITTTTATLNGTVNDNGAATTVTFEYGLSTGYGSNVSGGTVAAGTGATPVSAAISGLTCNTTYHFRVNASNAAGSVSGNDTTFTSAANAQTITFGTAPTIVVGNTGTVSAAGGASGNPVTFSSLTPAVCSTSDVNGATVTGVTSGTCTIAANQAGYACYAAAPQVTQSFTINSLPPVLIPPSITNLSAGSATLVLQSDSTGTGYFTLLPGNNAICGTGAQTSAGLDSTGAPAFRIGSLPLTATVAGNYTVRNLLQNSPYTVCFTADNSGYSLQTVAASVNLTTTAATTFVNPIWTAVGGAGFSDGKANFPSLAFAPDGTPFVVYEDFVNNLKATVTKYSAESWNVVGSAGFSAGQADYTNYTSLAFAPDGTPYVAYYDGASSGKATVMKYSAGSWNEVGSAGFSVGGAYYISLAFAPDGTPFVVYRDAASSQKATVMKFSGGVWTTVGSAGFSAGEVYFTSLAIAPDGTPYVAYMDTVNDYKATVMKYSGGVWTTVGNAGFSAGLDYYNSLAFAPDGTPYVAYYDGGYWGKATVMKYSGGAWTTVGSAGFSADQVEYSSLAFAPDGTPYVAFKDGGNSNKATVMKYSGGVWTTVGSAGFSAGQAEYTSLAIAPDGTPYVAYQDGSNGNRATVMHIIETRMPTATTGTATGIATTGVSLNGTINDNGAATTVTFDYGLDTNYGSSASGGTVAASSGTTPVSAAISGLTCNTTYHFRVTASNAAGSVSGNDATFTTSACVAQTITFGTAPAIIVGGTGTVSATGGGSGNPVNFTSQTPAVCTVSGATVTGVTTGTCTIAANQAGNAGYAPAPQVTQSFTVSPDTATLTVSLLGTGSGSVNSDPGGIACASGSSSGCSATFTVGAPVTLTALADWKSTFTGWGLPCSGTDSCIINLNGDGGVSATFTRIPRVRIPGPTPVDFAALQDAYATVGDGDILKMKSDTFLESLYLDRAVVVTLDGGWDDTFTGMAGQTTLAGSLSIDLGTAIISNLVIR